MPGYSVMVLFAKASVASPWCFCEVRLVVERREGKSIIELCVVPVSRVRYFRMQDRSEKNVLRGDGTLCACSMFIMCCRME
jgi:hypothetical protein